MMIMIRMVMLSVIIDFTWRGDNAMRNITDSAHLLVHVPAAEEACPAAECETSDELLDIARAGPQLDQGGHPQN